MAEADKPVASLTPNGAGDFPPHALHEALAFVDAVQAAKVLRRAPVSVMVDPVRAGRTILEGSSMLPELRALDFGLVLLGLRFLFELLCFLREGLDLERRRLGG